MAASEGLLQRDIPLIGAWQLQMRVGNDNVWSGWIGREGWRSRVLRAKRERYKRKVPAGTEGKGAGSASQGALPEIVKHSETCPQHGTRIRRLPELVGEAGPRRNVSICGVVQRSAARGQGDRCRIVHAHDREWIAGRILALQGRISVQPQAISDGQSRRDFPSILAIERKVLREQGDGLKCGWLSKGRGC